MQVTKKMPEEIGALARDGAYIFGLFLEGASWDSRTSSLEVLLLCLCCCSWFCIMLLLLRKLTPVWPHGSFLSEQNTKGKELVCEMPVVLVKTVSDFASQEQRQNQYLCPLYKTRQRSATYVWLVGLRSNVPTSRWVISGVALVLEP
jgi:dynein heavy chain